MNIYGDNFVSSFGKSLAQCRNHVESHQHTLMRCFRNVLRRMRSVEENFGYNYERFTNRLESENQAFDTQEQTLQSEASHFFTRLETSLTSLEEQFDHSSTRFRRYLDSLKQDIAGYDMQIQREAKRWYVAIGNKITDCEKMLLACDPRLKLKQGFSIVKDKFGNVLKSKKTIAIDDIIQIELSDGILDSTVKDIR